MRNFLDVIVGLALIALIVSCGSGSKGGDNPVVEPPPPPPENRPEPRFAWLQTNVFVKKCQDCHKPPRPAHDVDFMSYDSLVKSLGVRMTPLVPGDPKKSGIYVYIEKAKMPPPGKGTVTAEELAAVGQWITNGAKND